MFRPFNAGKQIQPANHRTVIISFRIVLVVDVYTEKSKHKMLRALQSERLVMKNWNSNRFVWMLQHLPINDIEFYRSQQTKNHNNQCCILSSEHNSNHIHTFPLYAWKLQWRWMCYECMCVCVYFNVLRVSPDRITKIMMTKQLPWYI